MATHKIVLIRHGESEWNKLNLFTGWTDVPLSDKGVEEAIAGGKVNSYCIPCSRWCRSIIYPNIKRL